MKNLKKVEIKCLFFPFFVTNAILTEFTYVNSPESGDLIKFIVSNKGSNSHIY